MTSFSNILSKPFDGMSHIVASTETVLLDLTSGGRGATDGEAAVLVRLVSSIWVRACM